MKSTPETREMAQQTYDWLMANPEHHDQDVWACETAMCVAGTVRAIQQFDLITEGFYYTMGRALDDDFANNLIYEREEAAKALGLEGNEFIGLFHISTNQSALDKLLAMAQGDEVKFHELNLIDENLRKK